MKRSTWLTIILVVAALALVKWLFLSPSKPAGSARASGQGPALVTAVIVETQVASNKLSVSGNVLANEEAVLRPEVAGKIVELYVKEGSEVQKGQLLVKLRDVSLQAQLKKATVQHALAKQKLERLQQLLEVKGVSQEEIDVAQTALDAASADIEMIKAGIDETEIRAPFNGIIGLRNISEGNYITPTDVIASIQQTDPVKIDFALPEKYAGKVRTGDTVQVKVEGSRTPHTGKVYAIDPKIDAATRTLKVRALCTNPKKELFPGSYAQVSLVMNTSQVAVVPTMAVIPDLRGQKAYVVKGGVAVAVQIETGARNDSTIEVIKGLNAGDTLVTTGLMSIRPGAPVKIQGIKR